MHYYLAPFIGLGTELDPYRPLGADVHAVWHMLELHKGNPDSSARCLLATPDRLDLPGQEYLGEGLDVSSTAVKRAVERRLGVTLEHSDLRRIIADLLLKHADGVRWNPVRPEVDGHARIRLGEVIFDVAVPRGGATIAESFNTADSDTLGPDNTWVEDAGDTDIVTNAAEFITSAATNLARISSTVMDSNDHYVEGVLVNGSLDHGVICRKTASATQTYYHARHNSGANIQLFKFITGSATQLGSDVSQAFTDPDTLKLEANGTTIRVLWNDVEKISVTNSDIDGTTVGGKAVGIRAFGNGGRITSLAAADLAAAGDPEGSLIGGKLIRGGLLTGSRLVR